jgi:glycosyltransferase involved in cell wall biosynthesis
MKIWLLPIEPFEERYTQQWYEWWPDELAELGFEVEVIKGIDVGSMDEGEFLDPIKTWEWKGSQVANLAAEWKKMKDGDAILITDGWGPATTAVAYMRETTGKDVKLVAFFHAGSYDPHDFLARKGCRLWGLDIERGWYKACDLVLVGSEFHVDMIRQNLGILTDNVVATGYPIHQDYLNIVGKPQEWESRNRLVVFPHRLAPEKQPHLFEKAEEIFNYKYPIKAEWKKTKEVCNNKEEYYKLLGQARVVVSFARQETFGIAMQEGIALGAWAVAPNRLSYKTVIRDGGFLFDDLDEAVRLIAHALGLYGTACWDGYHEDAIRRAGMEIMKKFGK